MEKTKLKKCNGFVEVRRVFQGDLPQNVEFGWERPHGNGEILTQGLIDLAFDRDCLGR